MVSSVLVGIEAKDKNLSEEVQRTWSEICLHRYQFCRQEKEAQTLKDIKKEAWQKHFVEMLFDSARRVDFRWTS